MRKRCAIDLVGQKIKIEDTSAKISEKIVELIKRDWQYLGLNKDEKKSILDELSDYVKANKKNKYRRKNGLSRVSKA